MIYVLIIPDNMDLSIHIYVGIEVFATFFRRGCAEIPVCNVVELWDQGLHPRRLRTTCYGH